MSGLARGRGARFAAGWVLVVVLASAHGWAIWAGMGGRAGLNNGWPIWRDDHPLYFHSGLVTRHFLRQTGTTAGYDPSFMAGYAKSVIFPASSTLPELVIALFGGDRAEFAYKAYVLASAALIPWLVAWGAGLWNARGRGAAIAVLLFLTYVWTDFPINYAAFGMLPYLLAIPLGLAATGAFCRYAERGGMRWWLVSTALMVGVVLVHLTGAMVVAPAAALAYATAFATRERVPGSFPRSRHVGVWLIPVIVLAANAFWWLPGLWLASTKGRSDFAFAHPEGILTRLGQIVTVEAPIESLLWGAGLVGLALSVRHARVQGAGLAGFIGAGVFWGYLAGGLRSLDFLQPGRHTYAVYTGLALASGLGLSEILSRLGSEERERVRLDRWAAIGLLLVGVRLFGPAVYGSVRSRVGGAHPFLESRPTRRLLWVVEHITRSMQRGERLLYEEGGFGLPGIPDPFEGGRFSGLLPGRTGIEVIGGPYLHASLVMNFTQFGEGKLFGKANWGRDHFERYARLYRPSYIMCWSPWSRGFCRSNPDLIEVLDDDGTLLFGRVKGFPGFAIDGSAQVEATPGRLVVRDAKPGVDGTVVLRYHSVPCLRTDPPTRWDSVKLEQDPTPFIRLRPSGGPVVLEIRFPPVQGRGPDR
jgi:hypothetical protein